MWSSLNRNEEYVLDLIEEDNGVRLVIPRLASAPKHARTQLMSKPYSGEQLIYLLEHNRLPEVELTDGSHLIMGGHGDWITEAAFKKGKAISKQLGFSLRKDV